MKVKNFLFSTSDLEELTCRNVFPLYSRSQEGVHGNLFNLFLEALVGADENDLAVESLLELTEAHYSSRLGENRNRVREVRKQLDVVFSEIFSLENGHFQIRHDLTAEQIARYRELNSTRNEMEAVISAEEEALKQKTLARELFYREARLLALGDMEKQAEILAALVKSFEFGGTVEVVDSDAENIEESSLTAIMQLV